MERNPDREGEVTSASLDQQISKFYVEHRLAVYRHLLLLGLTPAEAQEVAQEAFLALYRVLRGGEKVENWRAWLFRVARNLASNRRKAAGPSQSIDDAAISIAAGSPDPETQAIDSQRRDRVFQAIAALSPQQRECLQLRVAGFGYREIASIMGVKSSTVGEFLRRAIGHLKKAGL